MAAKAANPGGFDCFNTAGVESAAVSSDVCFSEIGGLNASVDDELKPLSDLAGVLGDRSWADFERKISGLRRGAQINTNTLRRYEGRLSRGKRPKAKLISYLV